MGKSLKRVRTTLVAAGVDPNIIRETPECRTAEDAANALGCHVDQIGKSIIFRGDTSQEAILFLTAGGNRVNNDKAKALAGEALGKADANLIRSQTGFAIGGVAPIGHLNPIRAFLDPRLRDFEHVWTAAGTPNHVVPLELDILLKLTGGTFSDFVE